MAKQEVQKGERWVRNKDGQVVTVALVERIYAEFDIHWRAVEGSGRGAIWQFNFLKTYTKEKPPPTIPLPEAHKFELGYSGMCCIAMVTRPDGYGDDCGLGPEAAIHGGVVSKPLDPEPLTNIGNFPTMTHGAKEAGQ